MTVKLALPKGRLQSETAALLDKAGWGLQGYHEGTRLYNLKSSAFPNLKAKLFQEKDIPIQVAIGNYDLGICGEDWVEELLAKYPRSAIVRVKALGYGEGTLYAAAGGGQSIQEMRVRRDIIRIASEYPNLAELLALRLRLRRFSVFPVWGGTEAYPPESAELAIIPGRAGVELNYGLTSVASVLSFGAFLIANRDSWETKDMSDMLASLNNELTRPAQPHIENEIKAGSNHRIGKASPEYKEDAVWLALPDGHQQPPTCQLLARAGICLDGYPSSGNRRPAINIAGVKVKVKVIRPQDMPLQVANGNFDLAITGRDWLCEHLDQFPSSPVKELADLRLGRVRIVAVVSRDLPVENVHDLRRYSASRQQPTRIASEYVNIADKFARDNHLGMYRIIPTWGATEAFLPDDADVLIENTETGQTIARHNLKIIDTLFESTACLIGSSAPPWEKAERIGALAAQISRAVEVMA